MVRKNCGLFLLCLLSSFFSLAQTSKLDAIHQYGKLPLAFESNHGQVMPAAKFVARGSGYSIFLTQDEAVLRLGNKRGTVLRTQLVGATHTNIAGEAQLPGQANYLIDPDPNKWITSVPTFERVRYAGVYPGVDLLYYGKQGRLEYDFVVAPRANFRQIRFRIKGADKLQLAADGSLLLESGAFRLRWSKPIAYQMNGDTKQPVHASYRLQDNSVAFEVAGYDRNRPLVIDPALVYSTYLGGSIDADPFNGTGAPGSASNRAVSVAVDANGNAYLAGTTSATDFPVTSGTYDTTENGSSCSPHGGSCFSGFVTKLNSTGSALVYSTYFGGGPKVTGLALDSAGRAYITGWVEPGFTGVPTTSTAFQPSSVFNCDGCGAAGFLSVLSANGSSLAYSTYFGETNGFSTFVYSLAVAVGTSGVAYIGGHVDGSDLPVKNAYQPNFAGGNEDGFVAKIDPSKSGAASLEYSTYLGGSDPDRVEGIATSAGIAYVTGVTSSATFPTTAGARDRTLAGSTDAFVSRIDTNQAGAASLSYSTLLGGAGADDAKAIAVVSGNAFVTGITQSTDFPVTSGATQKTHTTCGSDGSVCNDVFVSKLNSTGSGLLYSTYLGGSLEDDSSAIAVDGSGNTLVTGYTFSSDFPTTTDALDRTHDTVDCSMITPNGSSGCSDAFLTKISPTGSRMYSSFLGGSSLDIATGIARDNANNAYVTGWTYSGDFPTTAGAYKRTRTGTVDAFLTKVSFAANTCPTSGPDHTVAICAPQDGGTYASPVHVLAKAFDSQHNIASIHLFVDGKDARYVLNTNTMDVNQSMTAGAHRVTVQAKDSVGTIFKSTVNITVSGSTTTCSPSATPRTVKICSPQNGSTVAAPVHIQAAATPGASAIRVMQVYVDGIKKWEGTPPTIDTFLSMPSGTHSVTVQALDASGAFKTTVNITVQ